MIYYIAFILSITAIAEFYYIMRLRDKIKKQKESLDMLTYGYLKANGRLK